ncbi:MAG: hypothetical protein QXM96_04015 [Candidatus Woesearchaeota archaeon]
MNKKININKKAMEISPSSLAIVIVLLLIVLLIMLFIFGKNSKDFISFSDDIWKQGKNEKCVSPILQRYCGNCPDKYTEKGVVNPPENGWSDCSSDCVECVRENI